MQKIILYISVAVIALVNTVSAQEKTFEEKAKEIAVNINNIKIQEKEALKKVIESIDKNVENKTMTLEEANESKKNAAEGSAETIGLRIAEEENKLRELVNEKLDISESNDSLKKNSFSIPGGYKSKKNDENKSENRTTSQFVLAFGANNLVTDGAVANSQFGYGRSSFYEWGVTWNTRLSNNSNLLHLKYGVGFMYNNLHATDNRVFVDNTNGQTELATYPIDLKESRTYFKNVYFVVPMHLEFDFSKTNTVDDKKVFKSHRGARFGLGGFVGVNTNSKQFIEYKIDGYKFSEKQKGDFNVNDFTYGLSAYVGYKQTSLYLKYDLNPIFKNNPIDQNNISLGIRFDWN